MLTWKLVKLGAKTKFRGYESDQKGNPRRHGIILQRNESRMSVNGVNSTIGIGMVLIFRKSSFLPPLPTTSHALEKRCYINNVQLHGRASKYQKPLYVSKIFTDRLRQMTPTVTMRTPMTRAIPSTMATKTPAILINYINKY